MSLLKVLASLSKFKKHPSEFTMSFLKEGQQWFAFIPYYPLSKDDLEMVLGADVFLSYLASCSTDPSIVKLHYYFKMYHKPSID